MTGQALNPTHQPMKPQYLTFAFFFFILWGAKAQEKEGTDSPTAFFPKVEIQPEAIPDKENVWVFILAGQSNMAGRGKVEPSDTIPDPRILSINKNGELILAKEPLHFYEPRMGGLDCGLSFAKALLPAVPDSVSLLILPTAVGGSAIGQWIHDETFRDVPLLSNFKEKAAIGKQYGTIKGILWHQGENDAIKPETIAVHQQQLKKLFKIFRKEVGNRKLPVFLGELGSFSANDENWQKINAQIQKFVANDRHAYLIKTADLNHNGDRIHFESEGQRRMGERFAQAFIRQMK